MTYSINGVFFDLNLTIYHKIVPQSITVSTNVNINHSTTSCQTQTHLLYFLLNTAI